MGTYLNPDNDEFIMALNSKLYVDKSLLISTVNECVRTLQRYMCISRPRRFGKSTALNMLSAYYSRGEDTAAFFSRLQIARDASFTTHLNKYNVLRINVQDFLSFSTSITEMLNTISKYIISDLLDEYPDIRYKDTANLVQVMKDIYAQKPIPFIILIDEWDCLFREYQGDDQGQRQYLDFLRTWLKDKSYVGLVYMTGILPIKKYGTHSALNMFTEYSMTEPRELAEYFGFTENEVRALCQHRNQSYEEVKAWYDGYELLIPHNSHNDTDWKSYSLYNPKSVIEAMLSGHCGPYWNKTETYEALKIYIQMNYDGLKDAIVTMMAGSSVQIDTSTFNNDMTTFHSKNDVLTLLVHLGYLSYNAKTKTVAIPNREIYKEYANAVSLMNWPEVTKSIQSSQQLLQHLIAGDAEAVAQGLDTAHAEISILKYNDENSLSCAINLAFYFAREYYTIIRELPSGKGFADITLLPRPKYAEKPAIIIELKWDKSAAGAIRQIKERNYTGVLQNYTGNILLAGITYDKHSKKHQCIIEKI